MKALATCLLALAFAAAPGYVVRWHAGPLQTEKLTVPVVRGKSCFTVWAVDELGRPSTTPATISISVE